MNKVLIVIMFILLGTSLIVVSNMGIELNNSFIIEYQESKNLAVPDLTGKNEITYGNYKFYDNNGIVIYYNKYNGIWTVSGKSISGTSYIPLFNIPNNQQYTSTYIYVSGSINNQLDFFYQSPIMISIGLPPNNYQVITSKTTTITTQNTYIIYARNSLTFNNFQFKLQLEQGSTATDYEVPKPIPVYKDNLTQQQKNEIGLGAFGGITKILKTISDIIKPVGDFINGLLNIFNN